jgi:hypothetical protein
MTSEKLQRDVEFCEHWKLLSPYPYPREAIVQNLLAPSTIMLETDSGNVVVLLERYNPGVDANFGFVVWDRQVSVKEGVLRDCARQAMILLDLPRLSCYVPQRNRVMWRMAEKIGMRREGVLRKAFPLDGSGRCDYYVYGALRGEIG